MITDESVLAGVNAAFADARRPQRFTPFVADPEFRDHETLLQSRDRSSLTREDVGPGYDPMNSCSPEGIAYFFPCLAAFALQTPSDPWEWYGDQLIFQLSYDGQSNPFLHFCSSSQRRAILGLLQHIAATRDELIADNCVGDDLAECLRTWQEAIA
jgi:hypothetical protein